MRHDQHPSPVKRAEAGRPLWSTVLLAIREARSVTQDGWAARLGVSRRTVQRWERGEWPPDAGAEAGILAYCAEKGLFRSFERGPLAQVNLTPESLQTLFAEARMLAGRRPTSGDRPERGQPEHASPAPATMPPSSLPAPLTSFVGREHELAALRRVLAGTRLLTITGPGGVGKTRLALRLADELLWAYPHGIYLVDLAPLADPTLVPQTVAAALGLKPADQQPPIEALKAFIQTRRLLLVLDNCEHLPAACAELVEMLLRACPDLEVLTTSREPLGIGGETMWQVPPMTVPSSEFRVPTQRPPNSEPGTRNSEPERADAVRLFVERARLHRSEFDLTPQNAAAVAEVCRRLDGIPLAIELAAARVRMLSVEQIAARLGDRLRLLTGGSRTALPRHQTLRAALDWSHDLLLFAEQALLRRLSVFAGSWSLEAAEAVCGAMGSGQWTVGFERSRLSTVHCPLPIAPEHDVLDILRPLVDKSLVIAEVRDGPARYRMLETVRQYAAERLSAAGEACAVGERHALWCLALAEAASAHRLGPEQYTWLERLALDHDNIRAALGWCLADDGDVVLGLRLGGVLGVYWEVRGHLSEGRRWLATLLAQGGHAPPDVRARALNSAGSLARHQNDHDDAARLHEQSLALWRELGDEAGVALSLSGLGIVAGANGDYTGAWALLEESLALQRKLGDRPGIATVLMNLGITARRQGEPERAVTLYEESLALMQELGNTRGVAFTLQNLGNLHRDQGDQERAAARYREGLSLLLQLRDLLGAARCLEGLAAIAVARGDAGRAARLCGAAAALRDTAGAALPPAGRAAFEQTTTTARAALGEAEFAAAWTAGQALSLDGATAVALSDMAPA